MLRDRLEDLGFQLSEPFSEVDGQEVKPPVRPWEFIDEDLFGYMDPSGGRRRTSPVRVSPAIGLFPFQGDRDLGTRSFERFGQTMSAGGNMFETEVYANLFKGAILIELDRVGVFKALEVGKESEKVLSVEERRKRLSALLDALNLLWGGGRTARMLADLSPRFFAYARLKVKHPVFLESFQCSYEDGKYVLEIEPLKNSLDKFSQFSEKVILGLEPGVFGNEQQICSELSKYGKVLSVYEAIDEAKGDVSELWKESSD